MLEKILHFHGFGAYALIFALPALEASAFVGFIFPGEIAVFFGGVLAFHHSVALGWVIGVAIAGAVIGDSIGYEVGKHLGIRLLDGPLKRFVGPERRARATEYVRRNGGKAVFLGRFVAAMRVLVPGFAGMAEIPYPTFLFFNVIGGAVWATGVTLLGYFAGESYRRVEKIFHSASIVLLAIGVVVVLVVLLARWIARNPDRIRARWERVLGLPVVSRFRRQILFVIARFKPREAYGLGLTVGLIVLAGLGIASGFLIRDVSSHRALWHVDDPILRFLISHTSHGFTTLMRAVTTLGGRIAPIAIAGVVAVWLGWRKRWNDVLIVVLSPAGAQVIALIVRDIVRRPRPPVQALVNATGFGFPSGHTARAAALYGALALILARRVSWPWKVAAWTTSMSIVALVGFSRMYLRVHYLTDVLGGFAAGVSWLSAVGTSTGVWLRWRNRSRRARHPAGRRAELEPG